MNEKQQVYAVIRWDKDVEDIVNAITVKEIFPDEQEAVREVERLNKLNSDKNAHYFWQTTRFFPSGRSRSV